MGKIEASVSMSLLEYSSGSEDWVDHFNEIRAEHSSAIAGDSERSVSAAAKSAW